MKIVKSLVLTCLVSAVLTGSVLAQDAPNARVEDGNLILLDQNGNPVGDPIAPPAGKVLAGGLDLNDDGTVDVPTPTGTVLPGGGLDTTGDGNADYTVPDMGFMLWLNKGSHSAVKFDQVGDDIYIWSYTWKTMIYKEAFPNLVWIRELGAYFYFSPESGAGSMDGVWAYGFNFPKGEQAQGTTGTWTWFSTANFAESGNNIQLTDEITGYLFLAGLTPANDGWRMKEYIGRDGVADQTGIFLLSDPGGSYIMTLDGR